MSQSARLHRENVWPMLPHPAFPAPVGAGRTAVYLLHAGMKRFTRGWAMSWPRWRQPRSEA